ncbi:Microtubule-associated protein 70-2 [Glycine soja]|uniref:Microtubule-associated protein 70-2 n=1 Tax=Glycine soja TaxID=3848 RepID=A0A0B2NUP9_GLYSO|nr:Microtubule-associated protein 70-2 [Glycine soja]
MNLLLPLPHHHNHLSFSQSPFLHNPIKPLHFLPNPPARASTIIRMGGGPRTYPGGVSKWVWKRMQAKKAKQLMKARLCRERQIYEMRKRAELKAAVSELERPWEVVEREASASAPNLFSIGADEQVKVLADRFQRPGGFDLWSERDGPVLFESPDELPSARFFPKGVVHSVKPYRRVDGYGLVKDADGDGEMGLLKGNDFGGDELIKVDEKLKAAEALLESKNLEIKKINEEKRAALAAQFAAEATLRRVHAAQKDDEMPPIEAIIAPLEAELKLARMEVAKLQDDNRALDRLTKSKEAALLEAERTVQIALAKASLEENKILDKILRQKVAEVEKLTQTVRELEEAVLAGGAAANAVRDYQRKVQEMNEERKILEREVARAKVTANRVATVVANEWKDANDKVMPVKQWLEERKFFQACEQLRNCFCFVFCKLLGCFLQQMFTKYSC